MHRYHDLSQLEQRLQYRFKNSSLLELALTKFKGQRKEITNDWSFWDAVLNHS